MSNCWKVNEKETRLLSIDIKCIFLCSLVFQILFKKTSWRSPPFSSLFSVRFVYLVCWALVAAYRIFAALRIFPLVRSFSSCDTRAQLVHGFWNLSSPTGDQTHVPCLAGQILNHWATREVPVIVFVCFM